VGVRVPVPYGFGTTDCELGSAECGRPVDQGRPDAYEHAQRCPITVSSTATLRRPSSAQAIDKECALDFALDNDALQRAELPICFNDQCVSLNDELCIISPLHNLGLYCTGARVGRVRRVS